MSVLIIHLGVVSRWFSRGGGRTAELGGTLELRIRSVDARKWIGELLVAAFALWKNGM